MLWVTPTDILANITIETEKKLSIIGENVARVIPPNSILCTCIASIGKNTFVPLKCAFNQQINALTPFENNDPYFLFTNSYHWSQTMKKEAGGLTFQIVNKSEFSSIETCVPKYEEQKKIGNLFKLIDENLTLHQRKYFHKTSTDFKSLCFFNYAWEQYKLSSLITKGGSGGTPSTSNLSYYTGTIPFLSITDISNSNGLIFDTEKHITEEALNVSAAWIVPKESISLAMYASVGKVAILKENIATSQAFYNMVFKNLNTRDFCYQYLKMMEENDLWDSLISTGTQSNLNADKVKNLEIRIPLDINEQRKIGKIFSLIDENLTLHQRKRLIEGGQT